MRATCDQVTTSSDSIVTLSPRDISLFGPVLLYRACRSTQWLCSHSPEGSPSIRTHSLRGAMLMQADNLRRVTYDLVATNDQAARAITEFASALLPAAVIQSANTEGSLIPLVAPLNKILLDHDATIQHLLRDGGTTVHDVLQAVEAERSSASSSSSTMAVIPQSDSAVLPPPEQATNFVLRSASHKRLDALLHRLDMESVSGVIEGLSSALDGTHTLACRVLYNQTTAGDPLSKKDAALGILNDKRFHMETYLDFLLRVDPATGSERPILLNYSVKGSTFAKEFLKGNYHLVPWVPSPGLLGFQQHLDARGTAVTLNTADHYCIPAILDDLGPFGQTLLTGAVGYPRVVDERDGYSFEGMCTFFSKHIKLASRLESHEDKIKWISYAVERFKAALELATATTNEIKFTSDVANVCIHDLRRRPYNGGDGASITVNRPFIRIDAPPLKECRDRQAALATSIAEKSSKDIFGSPSSSSHAATYDDVQLPRLSSVKRGNTTDEDGKPTKIPRGNPSPRGRGGRGQPGRGRSERGGRGGRGGNPSPSSTTTSTRSDAGKLKDTWKYIHRGGAKYLVISGRLWNVTALARHLRVDVNSICWPYVLCRAYSNDSRIMRCDKYGSNGHGAHGHGAHIEVDVESPDLAQFYTPASEADKAGLAPVPRPNDRGRGGRGTQAVRGRSPGKGKGRGGSQEDAPEDPMVVDEQSSEAGKGRPARV